MTEAARARDETVKAAAAAGRRPHLQVYMMCHICVYTHEFLTPPGPAPLTGCICARSSRGGVIPHPVLSWWSCEARCAMACGPGGAGAPGCAPAARAARTCHVARRRAARHASRAQLSVLRGRLTIYYYGVEIRSRLYIYYYIFIGRAAQ